jgi:hypothetical protein
MDITPLGFRHFSLYPIVLIAATALGLSACGGGGGSSAPPNHVPSANAGNAITVFKRTSVTLDGSGSSDADGDPLTYKWSQTGGMSVTLSSNTSAKPTFMSPGVSGALTFQLIVNDGKSSSTPSIVTVTVNNRAPTAAVAGDATVNVATLFALDGSGSSDPDGDSLSYVWTQTAGASVQLIGGTTARPTFVTPAAPDTLAFQLIVGDGEAQSAAVTETVAVQGSAVPQPPVASTGGDQTSPKRASVVLYGSANPSSASYSWTQSSGSSVTLTNATSPNPSFVAPAAVGDLVFALVVSSGGVSSQPSFVTVHVTNTPPSIQNLALAPTAPRRGDAITATASIVDIDQDPVAVTYSWTRNGTNVPAATGASYPPGNQVKGDVIKVTVSASDGTGTSTATASATIADTPAVIAGSAPTTATYGSQISFTLTASDADNDPAGHFQVEYGPAGFQVSSSGAVTWTPSGPMFDRSVDQNWSVRLGDQPNVHMTGTITVTDSTRKYPLVRTNMGIPNGDDAIDVQDFDGSGKKQALIASNQSLYMLGKVGATYAQTWAYPFEPPDGSSPIVAVTSGDADGDGKREIFFASSTYIIKLDGVDRREVARYTNTTCTSLKFADIDGDGVPELVCLGTDPTINGYTSIYVLNARTMQLKWRTTGLNLGTSLAVGNVDGDAALELITNNGYVFDGVTQQNEWAYAPGFGSKVDVGDVSGDGVNKIVGLVNGSVTVFSATLKSPVWQIPAPNYELYGMRVDNLDSTGPAEIIVGDQQWGNVYVYRYNSGTNSATVVSSVNSQGDGVNSIGAGDMDGDGNKEIIWGSDYYSSGRDYLVVASWTPSMSVQFAGPDPAQLDGPFIGAKYAHLAANTDRAMFMVASSQSGYGGNRLMALDPATGLYSVSNEVDSNWAHGIAFDVGNVTGSGIDSILVGTATLYNSYFTAYAFLSNTETWSSTHSNIQTSQVTAIDVTHGDLTGDGVDDAIGIGSDGHVTVWDVKNQTVVWSSTALNGAQRVAVADMDGDGVKEIIALANDRVVIYARSGSIYIERASYSVSGTDMLVADADGDGKPELYVLGYGQNSQVTMYVLNNQLQLITSYAVPNANAVYLEASSFPRKNLVVATTATTGISYPYAISSELMIIDPLSGAQIWTTPALLGGLGKNALSFKDTNGDGQLEMVFGSTAGMFVTR